MKKGFDQTRLQFLPAALEIQHSPPHPLSRWLCGGIFLFFTFCVLWACFGTVDVVAVAEGKIIPSSRVKQIQPLEKGVVKKIFVHEGQLVNAGDPLIALDRTSSGAEYERLANELLIIEAVLARERTFLMLLEGKSSDTAQPNSLQTSLLEQQWQQYRSQLSALHRQLDHRAAEKQVNEATLVKLQATLPIITKRVNDLKVLALKKMVAENQYLEQEEARIIRQQDLVAAVARNTQLTAAMAETDQQILALSAQVHVQTLSKITDLERQANSLREQLIQAKDFDEKQVLYAPVAGQVKDLTINTVGGIVLEAQPLMLIVPSDVALEAEVWLSNQDIGFVRENDPAFIKVHTFPFTKYGTIEATIMRISDDAVTNENVTRGKEGLVYGMGLLMKKNALWVDGREVKLMPGMQITAEIITSQRRLIEYFLGPLQQHVQESVRER